MYGKFLGAGTLLLERLAQVRRVALELPFLFGSLTLSASELPAEAFEFLDQPDVALNNHFAREATLPSRL